MPTIDLTDDEFAAVTAAVRRPIEDDRFPRAPRLDPLRSARAKFEAAHGARTDQLRGHAPPRFRTEAAGKADKPARRGS
jgi:hypothetical protein